MSEAEGASTEEILNGETGEEGTSTEGIEEGVASEGVEEGVPEEKKVETGSDTEEAIFQDLVQGKNVFLSGPGGTGKSWMIKTVSARLTEVGFTVCRTGSTGVAADNIGGTTLHSWAGVQLGDKDAQTYYITLKGRNQKALRRWKNTTILIIDEISMIGAKFFTMLDQLGRLVRMEPRHPFGGLTLLIVGDVCQLPPVKDEYFFHSPSFEACDFRVYRLEKPWRFQKDLEFFALLSRVRLGEQTPDDIAKLQTRQTAYYREIVPRQWQEGEVKPTRLYSMKKDVHELNMIELEALPGDEYRYRAHDTLQKKSKQSEGRLENYQDLMNKNIPPEISLKKGAQVMLTANLDVENGFCNGSRGVVLECNDEAVIVKFLKGQELTISAHVWTIEDEDNIFTRAQIPLILASASTIHKIQSATLDSVVIDLGTTLFSPNMGYVALSRCRSLDGIYIINIDPRKIVCDPQAKEFEKNLL